MDYIYYTIMLVYCAQPCVRRRKWYLVWKNGPTSWLTTKVEKSFLFYRLCGSISLEKRHNNGVFTE